MAINGKKENTDAQSMMVSVHIAQRNAKRKAEKERETTITKMHAMRAFKTWDLQSKMNQNDLNISSNVQYLFLLLEYFQRGNSMPLFVVYIFLAG